MKCEPAFVALHKTEDVHDFRLEWIEAVEADIDQVVEQLIHLAARVDEHELSGVAYRRIHTLELRPNELMPEMRAHLQALLLAPVVAEIDGVDIVFQCLGRLGDVVVGDRAEQLPDEIRMVQEIHHQVLHPSQCPGPLVEGESDLKDPETIAGLGEPVGDVFKKMFVQRIGKLVSLKRGLRQETIRDVADIFIDAAVPHNAEHVTEAVVAEVLEKANIMAQLNKVIIQDFFQVVPAEMLSQCIGRLDGEIAMPRNIWDLASLNRQLNDLPFIH